MASQFLDLEGLKLFKNKTDERYAYKSHTHLLSEVSDWGSYIYSAQTSRPAGTVLASPSTSAGVADFIKINTNHMDPVTNLRGSIGKGSNWTSCVDSGWYQVAGDGDFTGVGAPTNVYPYGFLHVLRQSNGILNQIYISHLGDVLYRQAWNYKDNIPNYSSWHRIPTYSKDCISASYINDLF